MSKPVLYTNSHSVWATVPELALRELGYAPGDVETKAVNLGRGVNFAPVFLNIRYSAHDGGGHSDLHQHRRGTSYLVKHAPKSVKPGTSFVAKLHEDEYDPNFAMLLARSDKELEQKAGTFADDFIRNPQDALASYPSQPDAAQHKAFYDAKLAHNGFIFSVYQGTAPNSDKQTFFKRSTAHWNNLNKFVSEELVTFLPDTPFLGGTDSGEDDFHLAAWLARIAFVAGGGKEQDGVRALEKDLGIELHPKVYAYWGAWSARKSWQEVYAQEAAKT